MIIYRIEDQQGRGPYQKGWISSHLNSSLDFRMTPVPAMDGLDDNDWDRCKFGFSSLDQLVRWFGPELDYLNENGYGIGIYEVPKCEVFIGRNQIVFAGDFPQISFHKFSEKLDMNLVTPPSRGRRNLYEPRDIGKWKDFTMTEKKQNKLFEMMDIDTTIEFFENNPDVFRLYDYIVRILKDVKRTAELDPNATFTTIHMPFHPYLFESYKIQQYLRELGFLVNVSDQYPFMQKLYDDPYVKKTYDWAVFIVSWEFPTLVKVFPFTKFRRLFDRNVMLAYGLKRSIKRNRDVVVN